MITTIESLLESLLESNKKGLQLLEQKYKTQGKATMESIQAGIQSKDKEFILDGHFPTTIVGKEKVYSFFEEGMKKVLMGKGTLEQRKIERFADIETWGIILYKKYPNLIDIVVEGNDNLWTIFDYYKENGVKEGIYAAYLVDVEKELYFFTMGAEPRKLSNFSKFNTLGI